MIATITVIIQSSLRVVGDQGITGRSEDDVGCGTALAVEHAHDGRLLATVKLLVEEGQQRCS